jgi:Uri superfamily endonuclease
MQHFIPHDKKLEHELNNTLLKQLKLLSKFGSLKTIIKQRLFRFWVLKKRNELKEFSEHSVKYHTVPINY